MNISMNSSLNSSISMNSSILGQNGLNLSQLSDGKKKKTYACSKCKQPKRGHVCMMDDSPTQNDMMHPNTGIILASNVIQSNFRDMNHFNLTQNGINAPLNVLENGTTMGTFVLNSSELGNRTVPLNGLPLQSVILKTIPQGNIKNMSQTELNRTNNSLAQNASQSNSNLGNESNVIHEQKNISTASNATNASNISIATNASNVSIGEYKFSPETNRLPNNAIIQRPAIQNSDLQHTFFFQGTSKNALIPIGNGFSNQASNRSFVSSNLSNLDLSTSLIDDSKQKKKNNNNSSNRKKMSREDMVEFARPTHIVTLRIPSKFAIPMHCTTREVPVKTVPPPYYLLPEYSPKITIQSEDELYFTIEEIDTGFKKGWKLTGTEFLRDYCMAYDIVSQKEIKPECGRAFTLLSFQVDGNDLPGCPYTSVSQDS